MDQTATFCTLLLQINRPNFGIYELLMSSRVVSGTNLDTNTAFQDDTARKVTILVIRLLVPGKKWSDLAKN